VNVVLLARRQPALEEVAADIAAHTGAQTRTLAVDLTAEDAVAAVRAATADLEVGTMMYCAGADPVYQPFLANPVEVPLALVQRNCVVSLQLCHHFAGPMVERGRGAIVIVSSGAALAGAPNMVAYGASKAFDIVMAEALWSEVQPRGVDVLALVLGATDTPALRRLLASRGIIADPDDPTPIPDTMSADDTAAEALANLTNGPTWFVGDQLRAASEFLRSVSRNDAVNLMIQGKGGLMDNDRDVDVAP
jgi:short-subunit dehydrogenase